MKYAIETSLKSEIKVLAIRKGLVTLQLEGSDPVSLKVGQTLDISLNQSITKN